VQVRQWQAIGLVGRYLRRSERVSELIKSHVLTALETPNFRNVRIAIELCGANFFLCQPDAILDLFLPYAPPPRCITSRVADSSGSKVLVARQSSTGDDHVRARDVGHGPARARHCPSGLHARASHTKHYLTLEWLCSCVRARGIWL
jgi:hypothetical protein